MDTLLLVLATIGVFAALAVVAILILTLCGELLSHWRGEDF